jgi:hypothetical protein
MEQQTLIISEDLYNRITADAALQGVSIEQLLDEWERRESELQQRRRLGREIDELREKIFAKHGVMPDSTELLREDRAR